MKIKFCGAAQSVTGSRHVVEACGKNILLDCGMVQGGGRDNARKQNTNFLFEPKEIDFVIISHAHIDHVGMLPRLVKFGFRGQVFCTAATRELAEVMLLDSSHIQKQDAEFVGKKSGKKIEPLFDDIDVRKTMKLFSTFEYFQKFRITEGVWATFYDAGHVLGSSIVALDAKEEGEQKRLVYTGDLGRKYLPILNDPYQVDHADFLIIESTYAGHLHDSFSNVREELEYIVNDVVKRGGKIIIPGFSLERTQELVYVLHELYNAKKIPAIPIFVDSPLSSKISKIFDKYVDYYDNETYRAFLSKKQSPFNFKEIKYIESVEESKKLNHFEGSCIIISASGMCEAGRIQHHLKSHMTDPKNLILIVGFMAQGTRGRQIVEGARKIRIFGRLYPLRAEVVVMNAFSAHADKIELLEYVKNINDLEIIFIVHCEENECMIMRDNLHNILKFKGKAEVVDLGEEFDLSNEGLAARYGTRRKQYIEMMGKLKEKV
ncbi:MBL fold metallo-hydrolase [Patescibacteria group bacterium]|nr:MBL fold metallo-hydrolase [Patescibacteria group bacterium]